jgi:hypothetical protein
MGILKPVDGLAAFRASFPYQKSTSYLDGPAANCAGFPYVRLPAPPKGAVGAGLNPAPVPARQGAGARS